MLSLHSLLLVVEGKHFSKHIWFHGPFFPGMPINEILNFKCFFGGESLPFFDTHFPSKPVSKKKEQMTF